MFLIEDFMNGNIKIGIFRDGSDPFIKTII